MRKIPTGIDALDIETGGGIPEGSFILLLGESGTRKSDFCYTMASNCAAIRSDPLLLPDRENVYLPEHIWFAHFFMDKDDILRDVEGRFSESFYERFSNGVSFKRFIPASDRPSKPSELPRDSLDKNLMTPLGRFLEREGPFSLVFLYSLNDMVTFFQDGMEHDFIAYLQSIKSTSRRWRGVIVGILSKGILEPRMESRIISIVDGALMFEKRGMDQSGKARSVVYGIKYRGIESPLEEPFETKLTPNGLELLKVKTLI